MKREIELAMEIFLLICYILCDVVQWTVQCVDFYVLLYICEWRVIENIGCVGICDGGGGGGGIVAWCSGLCAVV